MRLRRDIFRYRWVLAAICFALITGFLMLSLHPSRSSICAASVHKIHAGMSRAEVEELLGGPPGNYGQPGTIYDAAAIVVPAGQPPAAEYSLDGTEEWRGDRML